jgi:RNA polymerase sigma-70 factor (ECF subfamily)
LARISGAISIQDKTAQVSLRMDTGNRAEEAQIYSLVERVRNGEREAFLKLSSLYQRKVFSLAYSFFRNREDALDIVQETFLRFYQKAGTFQKGNNFQNWLLQIAKNLCIDSYRKNQVKDGRMKDGRDVSELNINDEQASNHDLSSDLKHILSRCVNRLSEKQKMVFVLKQYNNLEYKEIAEILNIATGTAKSLHFKALQNLKSWVSPLLRSQA